MTKIPNKKISCIFIILGLMGLFADKFIPHTHHHDGFGAMADFSSDAAPSDPKENEEAGEKIHSEFFNISETANSWQFSAQVLSDDTIFAISTDISAPDIPIVTIEKYFLLPKITNTTRVIIKYFTDKAPPMVDVPESQFTNTNIYRRNHNERIKKSELAMV